jgi:hypothetical protein
MNWQKLPDLTPEQDEELSIRAMLAKQKRRIADEEYRLLRRKLEKENPLKYKGRQLYEANPQVDQAVSESQIPEYNPFRAWLRKTFGPPMKPRPPDSQE